MKVYKYYTVEYDQHPWILEGPEIAESFEELEHDSGLIESDWAKDNMEDGEYSVIEPGQDYLDEYIKKFPELEGYSAIDAEYWMTFFKKVQSSNAS